MALDILIVDDDAAARQRLRKLLARCNGGLCGEIEEAGDAARAAGLMRHRRFDLLLLDVQMPGENGLTLASSMRYLPQRPAIVFVTGHAEHALAAFEADAIDYITKPVRQERLERALLKACNGPAPPADTFDDDTTLRIVQRGQARRLPLDDVLYLRAENKRITVVTRHGNFMMDGSLVELQAQHAGQLLRVHRHTLVPRIAVTDISRDDAAGAGCPVWTLGLRDAKERMPVARRMATQVREKLLSRRR